MVTTRAGICEIMEALTYLVAHPEIKHGKIMCAFGPDEEIGTGADHFDIKQFPVDYAYTIDGESLGQLEYEPLMPQAVPYIRKVFLFTPAQPRAL